MFHKTNADIKPACFTEKQREGKINMKERKTKGYRSIAGLEKLTKEEIKARNLETYGSKIKHYRIKAGLEPAQLAEILQISESSVRNWECGLTRPDPEYLYRMFTILNVEPNEFFGFKGIGTLLTTAERQIIDEYRMLDDAGREALETFSTAMCEKAQTRKLRAAYDRMNYISNLGRAAAAGQGCEWPEHPEEEEVILYDTPEVSRADEIITVSGSSMEPQYSDGDLVLIQHTEDIRIGDIGIYYVYGYGAVIKQVAYDRLHSLNPDYDDVFPYEEGAVPIGRVIGKITKDMIPSAEEQMLFEKARPLFEK